LKGVKTRGALSNRSQDKICGSNLNRST